MPIWALGTQLHNLNRLRLSGSALGVAGEMTGRDGPTYSRHFLSVAVKRTVRGVWPKTA